MLPVPASHLIGADPRVLPDALLHEEAGEPDDEEHDDVGDHEGAAAILVGHVGEPPDVSQSHCQAQAGEEELEVVSPGLATHACSLG